MVGLFLRPFMTALGTGLSIAGRGTSIAAGTAARGFGAATKFGAKKLMKKKSLVFEAPWGYDLMSQQRNRFKSKLMKTASLDRALDLGTRGALLVGSTLAVGTAISELATRLRKRRQAERTFALLAQRDPHLSQIPEEELRTYFETIREMSPTVASNPLLLRTALRQMATYEGSDPNTIGTLIGVEERVNREHYRPVYNLADRLRMMAAGGGHR